MGVGKLGVAQALELAHEQDRALLGGQPANVHDQLLEILPALGLCERIGHRCSTDLEHVERSGRGAAELVDAAVVRHAVEPGSQGDRAVIRAQRCVGAEEDVLKRVLRVLA